MGEAEEPTAPGAGSSRRCTTWPSCGGAAGYAAAIYAGRARLSALLLDGMGGGGQLNVIDQIENYPGFLEPITGPDLQEAMRKQAERFGVAVTFDQIEKVRPGRAG
ncbi:MAG: hypothetical protein M0C28_41200 [Candidatus Moduliflexus flocculans]|nr:hypothetical protein [Candidatus Moduliflexus flocculans]